VDALVMCGGNGTRLESAAEKPLHPIDGVPMIDSVLAALEASAVDTIFTGVSPNAPETRAHLENRGGVRLIPTPGEGYVTDLRTALEHAALSSPVLTAAADLPLLEASVVDTVLARHRGDASLTVCVPVALKRRVGASVETTLESHPPLAPNGVNVVGDSEGQMRHTSYDPRLAINVNRLEDARLAATLRSGRLGGDLCE
jgi:adenosylcobinamide-phosphate guanylyltransferase